MKEIEPVLTEKFQTIRSLTQGSANFISESHPLTQV